MIQLIEINVSKGLDSSHNVQTIQSLTDVYTEEILQLELSRWHMSKNHMFFKVINVII